MEVKKSPKADLEGKKSTWLLVGYVVVLAFMFVAFEWTQRDVKIDTSQAVADVVFEEEIIPITETPEQAAPPPPEAPKVAELLEIVDDKADIEETTTIINEDNQARVEVKYVPVQVVEEEPEEQTIFEVVENMPDFPGGQAALMQYLAKNIKYPTIAQENGTQGRVIVQFVVNKDGSIVDAKVVRSVDPYLDKEAGRNLHRTDFILYIHTVEISVGTSGFLIQPERYMNVLNFFFQPLRIDNVSVENSVFYTI